MPVGTDRVEPPQIPALRPGQHAEEDLPHQQRGHQGRLFGPVQQVDQARKGVVDVGLDPGHGHAETAAARSIERGCRH